MIAASTTDYEGNHTMCNHEGESCWSGCNCPCMNCMFGDEEEEIEEEEEDLDFFTEGVHYPYVTGLIGEMQ